jgi:patatin-like phospholipase/acyl hydrolase
MRSYPNTNTYVSSKVNDIMEKYQDEIGISLATRATSAVPTYFPQVQFLDGGSKLIFWDGSLLNNNPIDQLWSSRYDFVKPDEPESYVSCVISLGTGYVMADNPSGSRFQLLGTASSVMDLATNTNPKGKDFSRHMSVLQKRGHHAKTEYLRFSPSLQNEKIDLAAYWRVKELITITGRECCHKQSEQEFLERTADAICC